MVKIYTAQSVGLNHDFDFEVDGEGNITALNVGGEVDYSEGMRRKEGLDIWPSLNETQKERIQTIYDQIREWFNTQFLG